MVLPLSAQNFNIVHADMNRMYKNSGDLLALTFTSVEIPTPLADDTIFHSYSQANQIGECVEPDSPFWLGEPVLKKENGDVVFNNLNDQSILIKNQNSTAPGYEWNCYSSGNLQNNLTIKATVDSVYQTNFLGLTDSVKSIRFQAYNTDGNEIESPVNGKSIEISKNYGLIKTLPFAVFPNVSASGDYYPSPETEFQIAGMSSPKKGAQNLTKLKAFDYQPGDEFHIKEEYISGSPEQSTSENINTIMKCLERTEYEDSLVYLLSKHRWYKKTIYYPDSNAVTEYITYDTVEKTYQPSAEFDAFPYETYVIDDGSSPDLYQNKMTAGSNGYAKRIEKRIALDWNNDGCFNTYTSDGCFYHPATRYGMYRPGLGGPYYNCSFGMFNTTKRNLVYYEKGDDSWGEPITIPTGNRTITERSVNNFTLFPNPGKDFFIAEFDGEPFKNTKLIIYDSQGITIRQYNLNETKTKITHNLKSGLYIYQVKKQNQTFKSGKLIIE